MANPPEPTIGFIGLGNMGQPMVQRLLEAGYHVVTWNRTRRSCPCAQTAGYQSVATPRELSQRIGPGIIGINVTDAQAIDAILDGPTGLASGLHPDALLIDFGTSGVEETRRWATRYHWLDCPVSGGTVGAENGTLTLFVGGQPDDVQRAEPILKVLGQRMTHLGPAGAGQATKLVNQLIVAQTIDAVAQAIRLLELSGMDAGVARNALLDGFADSRILRLHGQRMVQRQFAPGGRAALQLKDVRLICQMARDVGFHSPTLENSLHQWETLVETKQLGELDHAALYELYR